MGESVDIKNFMRVCIIAVLIIGLYIGAEAQLGGRGGRRGNGGGSAGGRVGGGRGRGGGKPWKNKRKGLDELCGTELDLDCEDGKWPRLFKGSACENITDGDLFPTYKELENPCTDAEANEEVTAPSCYVCGEKNE